MWLSYCGFSVFQNKHRGLLAGSAGEGPARLAPGLPRGLELCPGGTDLPEPWASQVAGARAGAWGGWRAGGWGRSTEDLYLSVTIKVLRKWQEVILVISWPLGVMVPQSVSLL